jgi:hypothetical protein
VVPASCRHRAPRRPAGRLFRGAASALGSTGLQQTGHCWSGKSPANVARLLTCGKVDGARGLPDGVVEGSLGSGGSRAARSRGGGRSAARAALVAIGSDCSHLPILRFRMPIRVRELQLQMSAFRKLSP